MIKLIRDGKTAWSILFLIVLLAAAVPGLYAANQVPDPDAYPDVELLDDRFGIALPLGGGAIAADGLLNEAAWAGAPGMGQFRTFFDVQPAERDTIMKAVYDAENLYIALQSPLGYDAAPQAERVFVLLGTPDDEYKYYMIPVNITTDSHPVSINFNNWTGQDPQDSRQTFVNLVLTQKVAPVVAKQPDGSWTAEMTIPWSALGSPQLAPGTELRLNAVRYYGPDSSHPASAWSPVRTSALIDDDRNRPLAQRGFILHAGITNEGRMGSLYLAGPPIPDSAGLAEPWQTQQPRLKFKSFGEKVLMFKKSSFPQLKHAELRLVWTTPSGERTVLDDVALSKIKSDYTIEFSHPAPLEDGQYRLQLAAFGPGSGAVKLADFSFDRNSLIQAGEHMYRVPAPGAPVTSVTYAPPTAEVQQLLQLIPDKVGFFAAGIPHNTQLGFRSANYTWSAANPWKITSADTQKLDYPNEQYPETDTLTVTNKLGQQVEYPYYTDSSGKRYFLSAHLWHYQRQHAVKRTKELAAADPLGAARLLYRFSQAYPGWVRINDTVWIQYPLAGSAAPPYPYFGGIWERWTLQELVALRPLADAFAEVDKTDAFELLSVETGVDVRSKIVDGMLLPSLKEVFSYPTLNHNIEYSNWIGLIQLGKALKEPQYIHEAVKRMADFAESGFYMDGFWKEITLSYHNQTSNGLRGTTGYAAGWTDPPGYLSSITGQRFDNFDPSVSVPQLGALLNVPNLLAYPNGYYYPINDTWAFQKATAPQNVSSLLMPGAGIAKLIRGQGAGQSQLYMTFSPKYGHDHKDPLNLALYAEGQELLPDIGYTHTFYRQWTLSTLGHNTVVVDGKDASIKEDGKRGGTLSAFVRLSASGDVQAMRAHQENAYPGLDHYSREPWFVGFDGAAGGEGYVLDLFRVSGGAKHEYTLNGDANRDAAITADVPLTPYGPYLVEGNPTIIHPAQETDTGGTSDNQYYGYIYVRDVQTADVPGGSYKLTMTTSSGNADLAGMKVFGFAGAGDNRLFIGEAPSLRATRVTGLSADTNAQAVAYTMPKFVLRKEGADLSSQFVHVIEPYAGGAVPKIGNVQVLRSDAESREAIVAVSYGSITDIILSSPDNDGQPLTAGDLTMIGKMGFIRLENGAVKAMYLAGGTLLQKGSETLNGEGVFSGDIHRVLRAQLPGETNGFVTPAIVPPSVAGHYIVVDHPDQTTHAYRITGVTRNEAAGETVIAVDMDPGFDYTSEAVTADRPSRLHYFPGTTWNGTHTFRIDSVNRLAP
ncbi:heparinase II/III domain-containing protein [Paenibacillus oceani]|uniref:Heparinase II/III family protein n=1 Tax=Paenibacillus oceani TaxID=2772510 RepID=A0A927C4J6_9BACL|nr:heparinase II/III family protein [Paenibacillus oceani]MBD2861209.1 heparinase II/III family protein [Paenibacillus oceani]